MKYARLERERRFLLPGMPPDLDLTSGFRRIRDLYITGTNLRLREVRDPGGAPSQFKFTQKIPTESRLETQITNLYLEAHEFELLNRLPGRVLEKRRYSYPFASLEFSIDQFLGPLDGLILSEVERPSLSALRDLAAPAFAHTEVTDEPMFTGGHLVASDPEVVLALARRLLAAS